MTNNNNLFVDVAYSRVNCRKERICGDTFLSRRTNGGNRTIIVLSDGLGHGVKANVLSTLTSTMLLNFISAHTDIRKISSMIIKTLPVCSVRKISYSTFTFIDIDHRSGYVSIVNHDNPNALIFRENKPFEPVWCKDVIDGDNRKQTIVSTRFKMQEDDRIAIMSDGVTQSGQNDGTYSFGWGSANVSAYLSDLMVNNIQCDAKQMSLKVIDKAMSNDNMKPLDDMSCAIVYIRRPERMILASCPPSSREHYKLMANKVGSFDGDKVVCGYPVAEIVASELKATIVRDDLIVDAEVPPAWHIDGIDLVTEGLVTLNKACDILEHSNADIDGLGPAYDLCRILTRNDYIEIVIGTKRKMRSSVYVPDEFELRRKVLKRIGGILEQKYMKQVELIYI